MAKDRLITFYEPVLTKTGSGAERTQYRELTSDAQEWAEVDWMFRGTETDEGKQRVAENPIQLKIWYRSDLREKYLIELEGRYYDITKISEGKYRRVETLIEAKAKDNDWTIPLYTP